MRRNPRGEGDIHDNCAKTLKTITMSLSFAVTDGKCEIT
jgi:hypothetical protein